MTVVTFRCPTCTRAVPLVILDRFRKQSKVKGPPQVLSDMSTRMHTCARASSELVSLVILVTAHAMSECVFRDTYSNTPSRWRNWSMFPEDLVLVEVMDA